MTCHRDGARHCSCAPEALDAAALEHGSHLLLASPDPRAHAALRLLAAPLDAEVVTSREGVTSVSGSVTSLLLAAVSALPATVLPDAEDDAAAEPVAVDEAPVVPDDDAAEPVVVDEVEPVVVDEVEPVVVDEVEPVVVDEVEAPAAPEPVPALEAPAVAPVLPTPPAGVRLEPAAELPHRTELLASLELAMARRRPGTTTGLLFCSIGDDEPRGAVLGAVAARIRGQLRRSDELAHLGGGRFVALLADLPLTTGEGAAARVVAAVRDSLAEPVSTSSGLFPLGALVGVLVHPSDVEEAAQEEASRQVDDGVPSPTAEHMLAVVERAMERGPLPAA